MDSFQISPGSRVTSDDMAVAVEAHVTDRGRLIKRRLTPQQIRSINEYVDNHLGEGIRTHHLSEVVNLSRFHFCRVFRLTVGTSPRDYLSQLRLQRVKLLLRESSSSLCEIAHLCGFADQSHLTRMFRSRVGTTPARWRQQLFNEAHTSFSPGEMT